MLNPAFKSLYEPQSEMKIEMNSITRELLGVLVR